MDALIKISKQPGFGVWFQGNRSCPYLLLDPYAVFVWNIEEALDVEAARFEDWKRSILIDSVHESPSIFGYITYELGYFFEGLTTCIPAQPQSPVAVFIAYSCVIRANALTGEVITANRAVQDCWWKTDTHTQDQLTIEILALCRKSQREPRSSSLSNVAVSEEDSKKFCENVEAVREQIRSGYVYQANISLPISVSSAQSAFENFATLFITEPGNYSAFLSLPNFLGTIEFLYSNSPELFLQRDSTLLRASPIKGTTKTKRGYLENETAAYQLTQSAKNLAELSMIVDLFRNDLHKVTDPASSAEVQSFPELLTLSYIHHLTAQINISVKKNISDFEIIQACFPSGSITGAPKYTAMQTIASLERRNRGVYCGSFIGFSKSGFTSSVAIRTASQTMDSVYIQAGAGITIDSDPAEELSETKQKLAAFAQAIAT